MNKEVHIHVHTSSESHAKKGKKQTKKKKTLDKRTQAIKGAKIALSYHSKELFKHFGYSAFYTLKLLGFALRNWGEKQKAKQKKQKDGKAETFKSPLLVEKQKDGKAETFKSPLLVE